MKTNKLSQMIVSEDDMVDVLYRGEAVDHIVVDNPNWVKRYNKHCTNYDLLFVTDWTEESTLSPEQFIQHNVADWYLPTEYMDFDLEDYLLSKCTTIIEIERVQLELTEFNNRNMIGVLKWMKYFVDTLRKNNQIWGAGRGSSVASYVLFLLEVHRVNSIKYELDIKEFLK
jgi:DNA polymerase III alpha subunit